MKLNYAFGATCAFCVFGIVSLSCPVPGKAEPHLAAFKRAILSRESRVRSATITWEQQSFSSSSNETVAGQRSFTFDSESWRYDQKGKIFHSGLGKMLPNRMLEVWSGSEYRKLAEVEGRVTTGSIYPPSDYPSLGNRIDLYPILLTLRATTWGTMSIANISEIKEVEIGGKPCVMLREKIAPGLIANYFADSGLDYSIIKYEQVQDGLTFITGDISYQKDAFAGYLPAKWKLDWVASDGKSIVSSVQGNLLSSELNLAVDKSEFSITFPLNSFVTDGIRHQKYTIDSEGVQNQISNERLADVKTSEELFAPKATRQASKGKAYWVYVAGGGVFVLLLIIIMRRVTNRARSG